MKKMILNCKTLKSISKNDEPQLKCKNPKYVSEEMKVLVMECKGDAKKLVRMKRKGENTAEKWPCGSSALHLK